MQKQSYSQILEQIEAHQFFVVDKKVCELYPELKSQVSSKTFYLLEEPESEKNFEVFQTIINFFLESGMTRSDSLVSIGGGATSDITGFVAATILRGVPWKVIPTTLLAMVDAAIGGKTGINTKQGKNLVGAFHLPAEIFLCQDFLKTLPQDELESGKGEVLKYLILSRQIHDCFQGEITNELILKCAEYKQHLVTEDFHEKGVRRLLNLGHTFGHALEKSTKITHGRAVAIGMKWIITLYCPVHLEGFTRLAQALEIDLNFKSKLDFGLFKSFVEKDKKRVSTTELDIIVPANIGVSEIKKISFDELFSDLSKSPLNEYFN